MILMKLYTHVGERVKVDDFRKEDDHFGPLSLQFKYGTIYLL